MLPSFSAGKSHLVDSRCPALGRDFQHTARQYRQIDQRLRLQRHVAAAAQVQAGRRALGNLALTLFVVVACAMAAYTLHAEHRQEQQLQERLR